MPAHFTPDRSTAPHLPVLMCRPIKPRQLPSLELGKPPKLQPHPKSQLQNSYPCPLSVHLVFVVLAVATAGPSSQNWKVLFGHGGSSARLSPSGTQPPLSMATIVQGAGDHTLTDPSNRRECACSSWSSNAT